MQIILIVVAIWYFFFRKTQTASVRPFYGNNFTTFDDAKMISLASEIVDIINSPVFDESAFLAKFKGLNSFDFDILSYKISNLKKGFLLDEYIRVNVKDLTELKKQFPDTF